MFGTVGFVSKSRLQKYIGTWDSLYSFSSYRPFSKPEVTHLSPLIALRMSAGYNFDFSTFGFYLVE